MGNFRRWHNAGFTTEILPIIPPHAELTPGTDVQPQHRGKTPGAFTRGGTWSGLGGKWSIELTATTSDLKAWSQWGASVGLQSRTYLGLDIDVEDGAVATIVADLAAAYLGIAPVRVRDGSQRRLLIYKRAEGAEPIRKVSAQWIDAAGEKQAVELLGMGQQFVVEGPHPKGGEYRWLGEHPCDCGPAGIGEVSQDHVDAFFAELARYIETKGWAAPNTARVTSTGASGARKGLNNVALHAPSPELVIEALKAWPNSPDNVPSHNDFVAALVAIKAALGDDRDDHYNAVEDWALEYDGNDADYVRKTWDSINDASVGWEFIAGKARAGGFSGDAQDDFEDATDDANEGIPETSIERMCSRYVWVQSLERYVDLRNLDLLTGRAFNAANTSVAAFGSSGVNSAEATFQNAAGAKKANIATFRPGKAPLIEDTNQAGQKVKAVNLWRPSPIVPADNVTDADVAPWLAHVEAIFGAPGELGREHFLNWTAFLFQRPGVKINHAFVLMGSQGVGKDTVFEPIFAALGRVPNVRTIKTEDLDGQWTDYLLTQVVVVEEMMNFARRELYNKLKDMTAAPPTHLRVNGKNEKQFYIPNIQNWVVFTNHDDAIALDTDDRRFFVHRSLLEEPKDPDYYDALHDWFVQPDTPAKVAGWLKARDISAFKATARPPMTTAKADMIESAMPAPVRYLSELLGQGGPFAGRELVSARELVQHARTAFDASPKAQEAREKHAVAALRRCGYSHVSVVVTLPDGSQGRLWTKKPAHLMAQLGGRQLRQRYEAELNATVAQRAGS